MLYKHDKKQVHFVRSSVPKAEVTGLIFRWMVSPHLSWSPMVPLLLTSCSHNACALITSKNKRTYLQTHSLYIKTALYTCPSNTGILNIKRKSFYLYFILGCTSEYTIVIMGFTGKRKIFKSSYHLFSFN